RERPLAAGQQVDALCPLAARGRMDVDRGLERIVRVLHPDVRLSALEQAEEGLAEVLADVVEGAREQIRRGLVDLADGRPEVVARLDQIVPLSGEEVETLALLGVLLDGQHVDRSDALERAYALDQLLLQPSGLALHVAPLLQQRLQGPAPLALETVTDALDASRDVLALELQLVAPVRRRPLRGAGLAHVTLGGDQRVGDPLERRLPLPRRGLRGRALGEQPLGRFL